MKKYAIFCASILLLNFCNNKNKNAFKVLEEKKNEVIDSKKFHSDDNETLKKWIGYYKKMDPKFDLEKFEFVSENFFEKTIGNIYGIYDKEFDKNYTDFLIYSQNHQKYIDLDSNNWSLDDEGELGFEVDQEVNLVDIPNKKIEKIAFYGSQNWVEDAYWKDDHTIVLLGNSYEQHPTITEINIDSMKSKTFKYHDSLKSVSEYSKQRIITKLKKAK